MKRAEKLALLKKVVQGTANKQDLAQIQKSNGAGGVVIIYEVGDPHPGPDDEVSFHFNGKQVKMPLREIEAYTRYSPLTLFFIPNNHRRNIPINEAEASNED